MSCFQTAGRKRHTLGKHAKLYEISKEKQEFCLFNSIPYLSPLDLEFSPLIINVRPELQLLFQEQYVVKEQKRSVAHAEQDF